MICDNLPNEKKYDNGRLPAYFYQKNFYIRGIWYSVGDIYDPYSETYDGMIWKLREGIIGTKRKPIYKK